MSEVTQFQLKAIVDAKNAEAATLTSVFNQLESMSTELKSATEELTKLREENARLKKIETEASQVASLLRQNAWVEKSLIDIVTDFKEDHHKQVRDLKAKLDAK